MLKAYRRVFLIWHGYRRHLVLCQVLLLISGAASIAMATMTQKVINEGLVAGDTTVIVTTGIWMAVLALVAGGAMAAAAAIAVFFMQGTAWVMRTELYSKLQDYSFENFDRIRTGDLLTRLSSDIDNVSWAVLYGVLLILYAPFMLVIAFVLTLFRSPSLVWLLLVATGVVIGMMVVIAPIIFKAYVKRQERLDDVNATLQESLTGVRVVKAFTREKLEEERAEKRAAAMRKPAFTAAFTMALMQPLINASAQAMILVSVWYGGWRVLDGKLNLGELIAFTQYLSLVAAPLAMLAIIVPFILRGGASIERLLEAYDAVPAVLDREDAQGSGARRREGPARLRGRLLRLPAAGRHARPAGAQAHQPHARARASASASSARPAPARPPSSTSCRASTTSPRGASPSTASTCATSRRTNLRQIVGIALQEAVLFQGDVRFNLKFGAPDVDDEVMRAAAAAADADEFVDDLPERWDAPVSRRGYNFSGGQRQRLSMARTLTPLPRILILDDSTSALDVATESRVQAAIPEFAGHATTLYVAQRISAVIDLDKVVLMDRGEITDVGSHEELHGAQRAVPRDLRVAARGGAGAGGRRGAGVRAPGQRAGPARGRRMSAVAETKKTGAAGAAPAAKPRARAPEKPPDSGAKDATQYASRLIGTMVGDGHTAMFVLGMVLLVIAIGGLVTLPFVSGEAINVISAKGSLDDLSGWIVAGLVAAAVYLVTSFFAERIMAKLATGATYTLQTRLAEHLQTLSLGFFDSRSTGELVSSVTNDVGGHRALLRDAP